MWSNHEKKYTIVRKVVSQSGANGEKKYTVVREMSQEKKGCGNSVHGHERK